MILKLNDRKTATNSLFEPVGLDLANKLSSKDFKTYADRLRYITNYLYISDVVCEDGYDGWINIHSKHLADVLSRRRYKSTVEIAQELAGSRLRDAVV